MIKLFKVDEIEDIFDCNDSLLKFEDSYSNYDTIGTLKQVSFYCYPYADSYFQQVDTKYCLVTDHTRVRVAELENVLEGLGNIPSLS